MTVRSDTNRRRDPRFSIHDGSAWVDLPADSPGRTPLRAPLNEFSSSGVRFEITRTCAPALGTRFECVGLQIGECSIHGGLLVKNIRDTGGPTVQVGALFYSESDAAENRLMGLLTGLAARP